MTRLLLSIALCLPLVIVTGCVDPNGTNPDDDDCVGANCIGDDDDVGVDPVTTYDINIGLVSPDGLTGNFYVDNDLVSENATTCNVEMDQLGDADVTFEIDDRYLFDGIRTEVVEDGDSFLVFANDEALDTNVSFVDDADGNTHIEITADAEWTGFGSWCLAPNGDYMAIWTDPDSGAEFEIEYDVETNLVNGQCVTDGFCSSFQSVVDGTLFTSTDTACNGVINDDMTVTVTYGEGEDAYDLTFNPQ